MGFPIRKFSDQSLFAAPQDLSQRTTSFIASQRQGIHRIPFWHLIVLIIEKPSPQPSCKLRFVSPIEKTILLQTHPGALAVKLGPRLVLYTTSASLAPVSGFKIRFRLSTECVSSSRCQIRSAEAPRHRKLFLREGAELLNAKAKPSN